MPDEFDAAYRSHGSYFGDAPDDLLASFLHLADRSRRILDIGAGQGRNAMYAAWAGFEVDAIDPSPASFDIVSAAARRQDVRVRAQACSFETFSPEVSAYGAVMAFGLIPLLPWSGIHLLRTRIDLWTRSDGLVFATGFTTEDPAFPEHAGNRACVGRNSFAAETGEVRTYLEKGEILELFAGWEVLFHSEGLGPEHRHGDGPLHCHGLFALVARNPISP